MSTTTIDYRQLSVTDRIKMIGDIWDSLIDDGWRPPLSDAFKAELDCRIAEHRKNPESAIPWEEVKQSARRSR